MCHSLNGQGGRMGPTFEAVSGDSSRERVMQYIKSPQSLSAKSMMPGYPLTDEQLGQLADFIMGLKK